MELTAPRKEDLLMRKFLTFAAFTLLIAVLCLVGISAIKNHDTTTAIAPTEQTQGLIASEKTHGTAVATNRLMADEKNANEITYITTNQTTAAVRGHPEITLTGARTIATNRGHPYVAMTTRDGPDSVRPLTDFKTYCENAVRQTGMVATTRQVNI